MARREDLNDSDVFIIVRHKDRMHDIFLRANDWDITAYSEHDDGLDFSKVTVETAEKLRDWLTLFLERQVERQRQIQIDKGKYDTEAT